MFKRYENGKPVQQFAPAEYSDAPTEGGFADTPRAWRVERYLELGFTDPHAELLADTRDSVRIPDRKGVERTWSFPLYWGNVAKMLEAGWTHDQVVAARA